MDGREDFFPGLLPGLVCVAPWEPWSPVAALSKRLAHRTAPSAYIRTFLTGFRFKRTAETRRFHWPCLIVGGAEWLPPGSHAHGRAAWKPPLRTMVLRQAPLRHELRTATTAQQQQRAQSSQQCHARLRDDGELSHKATGHRARSKVSRCNLNRAHAEER